MSNPIIWLYQFWLFTVPITSSGNWCGLNTPKYGHTFYRDAKYRPMHHPQNEEWLPLLIVPSHCWHHRRLVATSDWIVSLCGYWTELLYCTKFCVFTTIWQKTNLIHGNTANISHVPIFTWPGMTSSLTSHGSVNDITEHFPLNSFLLLSFDTKMSQLKRLWKVLRANQCYGILPLISINVSSRKTVSLKTFPWIFPHPDFIKNTITFDGSYGVNVRFVHRVL